ncbi:MAG: zinc ribbon domain-containing protein [Terriglobia bacterium]
MTNDQFLGRFQDNWKQRSREKSTLASELRVIPSWLVKAVIRVYVIALIIAELINLAGAKHIFVDIPQPIFPELGAGFSALAVAGVVTAVGAVVGALILIIGYVYGDAKRRGMNPVLWTLVALLVPYLLGALLYFVVREPLPFPCPQCGLLVDPHFNYCPSCQLNLRPNCPQCRRAVLSRDRFCPHCGFTLQIPATSPQ